MKQPNSLLKLATITSSVLLAGEFVSYSAGAFDWLMETERELSYAQPAEVDYVQR